MMSRLSIQIVTALLLTGVIFIYIYIYLSVFSFRFQFYNLRKKIHELILKLFCNDQAVLSVQSRLCVKTWISLQLMCWVLLTVWLNWHAVIPSRATTLYYGTSALVETRNWNLWLIWPIKLQRLRIHLQMTLMYQVMVKNLLHFTYNVENKPKSRACITALPVSHSAAGVQPSLQLPSSGFTTPAHTITTHTSQQIIHCILEHVLKNKINNDDCLFMGVNRCLEFRIYISKLIINYFISS